MVLFQVVGAIASFPGRRILVVVPNKGGPHGRARVDHTCDASRHGLGQWWWFWWEQHGQHRTSTTHGTVRVTSAIAALFFCAFYQFRLEPNKIVHLIHTSFSEKFFATANKHTAAS